MVAAKDYYLGFVSTTVSLDSKNPEAELKKGLDLLEPIEKKFISVKDVYHPKDDGKESQVCHHGIKMTILRNDLMQRNFLFCGLHGNPAINVCFSILLFFTFLMTSLFPYFALNGRADYFSLCPSPQALMCWILLLRTSSHKVSNIY